MKNLLKCWFLLIGTILLTGCGSNRQMSRSDEKALSEREQYLYAKSDEVFLKFKDRKEGSLNQFTVDYIGKYKNIAIDKMLEYDIPASITLAQGILESGNGLSTLAQKSNNHFGIKCHSDWKGKRVYHDDDRRNECFRKYPSPEGSFNDHSIFLTSRGRYEFLFDLPQDDYKAWAKGLKKAGYATDRKYPKKLISFIENFELYRYDELVLDEKGYRPARKEVAYTETPDISTYTVIKGDTLYSIARRHDLSVEELKDLNNLSSNEISIGQELIVSD